VIVYGRRLAGSEVPRVEATQPNRSSLKKKRDTSHFSALLADARNHHSAEDGFEKFRGTHQSGTGWKQTVLRSALDFSIGFTGGVESDRPSETYRGRRSAAVHLAHATDVRCAASPQGSTE
jgi:hypothetical protein